MKSWDIVVMVMGGAALLMLILIVGAFIWIQFDQIVRRRSIHRPEFSRENVITTIKNDYPENQRVVVLGYLDQWQQYSVSLHNTLLAQVQMSILKIAHGDIQLIKKYTEDPESYDYRDIISKAGYG